MFIEDRIDRLEKEVFKCKPKSDVDISFTLLAEIEELEVQLADKIEELNSAKISVGKLKEQRDFWEDHCRTLEMELEYWKGLAGLATKMGD